VLLQFVDPNALAGHEHEPLREGEKMYAALHLVADLADYSDYSTHENQLILAKQLIEHGADVNAVTRPRKARPLHLACCAGVVTNLDFVELLLKEGADPNSPDLLGVTPLMYTVMFAPGAANFLLNWPTTDANITTQSGGSYLAKVRVDVMYFPTKLHALKTPRGSNTESCSSGGVKFKRCWWKGEPSIPVS
jgi:hypothetical protein